MLVLMVADGLAQSPGKPLAKMVTKAYAPLPADLTVAIDYREDTELNSRLRAVFERALTDRGHRVSDDADFVLEFESLVEEKLGADKPVSVVGRGGSKTGSEVGFELRLPLDKPKPAVGGRRYSLNVSLAMRSKPPLWGGSAVAVGSHGDRFAVQSAMVRALVGALGQTVEARSIAVE